MEIYAIFNFNFAALKQSVSTCWNRLNQSHRGGSNEYEYCGIRESTHKWISLWLSERSHKVVLDGQASDLVPVLSGSLKVRP